MGTLEGLEILRAIIFITPIHHKKQKGHVRLTALFVSKFNSANLVRPGTSHRKCSG